MRWMPRALVFVTLSLTVAIAASCGGAEPGTRPDDMSAEEHRSAADSHEQQAAEHREEYDPDAERVRPGSAAGGDFDYGVDVYNPTQAHLQSAEAHRDIAEQHRAAAAALEQYEDEQCGRFPPETRAQCPLLGHVVSVEDIDGGARIRFADDVNVEAARAHVGCHVAFARTEGREGMDQCPMYVEGARAETDGPEGTVDLVTDDEGQVDELRQRARAHVAAE